MRRETLNQLTLGPSAWNLWRRAHPTLSIDLTGVRLWELPRTVQAQLGKYNLANADLSYSEFPGADLVGASLRHCRAIRSDFEGARLDGADLSGATLLEASFYAASAEKSNWSQSMLRRSQFVLTNLRQAAMRHADFIEALVDRCVMSGCDVSEASLTNAIISRTDLRLCLGLDRMRGTSPASVDVSTIRVSKHDVPARFWKTVNVTPTLIDYIDSIGTTPVELYSCFISHSSKDALFCRELAINLREADVKTWYFPENAVWGKSVWGEIDQSIRLYDKLILVGSQHSLTSGPVLRELERALNREDQQNRSIVFPLTIDNFIFEHWQHPRRADVLAKVVADFRSWRTSALQYKKSIDRLIAALQRESD